MPAAGLLTVAAPEPPDAAMAAFTARLAAGEDAAWTEAHGRYAPRLFRYLLVAARGDEQAAGDALQAAFVRAVRHARVFQTEAAFWGWITLLARHCLADHRRSRGRWFSFLHRFHEQAAADAPTAPDDPLPEMLEEALAQLDEDDRCLLQRKYFEAASVRELAAADGATEKAIEARLSRARARLRQLLLKPLQP